MKNNTNKNSIISKDGVSYLIPFILITSCFALWGFANDITNPMVKAFSKKNFRLLQFELHQHKLFPLYLFAHKQNGANLQLQQLNLYIHPDYLPANILE